MSEITKEQLPESSAAGLLAEIAALERKFDKPHSIADHYNMLNESAALLFGDKLRAAMRDAHLDEYEDEDDKPE